MSKENTFIELDQIQIEQVSGAMIVGPIFPDPIGYRFALWVLSKFRR
ncbi:MAG: hypothetical protein Q4G22_13170 [Paracoccus sp. (in: a-proteobacteria)]|nr:hypothetical protein [Paracoccus sp. (in: a-proteobacteria)]MDO5632769.1 hypothetical protein [Paracoccus sp. (in: a-proteobacteria)]